MILGKAPIPVHIKVYKLHAQYQANHMLILHQQFKQPFLLERIYQECPSETLLLDSVRQNMRIEHLSGPIPLRLLPRIPKRDGLGNRLPEWLPTEENVISWSLRIVFTPGMLLSLGITGGDTCSVKFELEGVEPDGI